MRPLVAALVAALALATACGVPAGETARSGAADGPRYAPYGLGTAPDPARLASWDRDIGPGGAALPAGRGTAAAGRALYVRHCAACHGANGEGMEPAFPPLVGRPSAGEDFDFASAPDVPRTIGNYWPQATTLFDYIRRAMPLLTPGSLTDDETYSVTAYLLAANRVIPDTTTLDAAALRAVRMPARDRFVPDDRAAGGGVRVR
jgi:cytochrome c